MTLWLDAQRPPSIAPWIPSTFGVECRTVRDVGLRDAKGPAISVHFPAVVRVPGAG